MVLCLRTNLALPKVPEVAHVHSFYPRGLKLRLFLLYAQLTPSHRAIVRNRLVGGVGQSKIISRAHLTKPQPGVRTEAHLAVDVGPSVKFI